MNICFALFVWDSAKKHVSQLGCTDDPRLRIFHLYNGVKRYEFNRTLHLEF
jgi:hypothetical protein